MIEDDVVSGGTERLGDPLATVLATRDDALLAADSREYLREQTRLARLQSENLVEQNAFEMSHLRWRRLADRVRGTGHGILVLLGVLLIVAIGGTIWSAANDHRLVVESFSVPPALAEQGETGTVVAQHVLDRIIAMQGATQSLRAANSYRNNWGDDLKVQIPETGISLSEAYRGLVNSLGHQTRITGEVVRSDNGFALTTRAGTGAGSTFRGNNLDALLSQAAEWLFAETQPYRYGVYLANHGREAEAKTVLLALAQGDAPASERGWAYSGLLFAETDARNAERYGYAAVALNPRLLLAHNNLASVEWRLGHSENFYREAVTGLTLLNENAGVELDQRVLGNMHNVLAEEADATLGDYGNAVREMRKDLAAAGPANLGSRSQAYLARDLALMHDLRAARSIVIDPWPQTNRSAANRLLLLVTVARAAIDMEANDWNAAKTELSNGIAALGQRMTTLQLEAPLALVDAKLGEVAPARVLAAKLSADCYPCLIARAQIEAIAHNPKDAAALFAAAVSEAPSIPFAYTVWGTMLMDGGDYAAAIAKFEQAHAKGPHFADPLEMWGEALIQKNRSDLALAKFEEANKYAPNWGRLHLKWGEALYWSNDRAGAHKQFDIASHLDLSNADSGALARARAMHD